MIEIESVTDNLVKFSVLYPDNVLSITPISIHSEQLIASAKDDDIELVRAIEQDLLKGLRSCSVEACKEWRDEYDCMFTSCVVSGQLQMRTMTSLTDLSIAHTEDVCIRPVKIIIMPGNVHILWSIETVDIPTSTRFVNDVIAQASTVSRQLDTMVESLKMNSNSEQLTQAVDFLNKHKFYE